MENNKNNNIFYLLVRNRIEKFIKIEFDISDLNNYQKICQIINKIREYDNSQLIEIELKQQDKESIKIYDQEEWNLLYDYNIINEYIKGDKLKLYSKAIKKDEIINKKENLKKIIICISKKLFDNFYPNIIFKFISLNKDILDLFISFYVNELKSSNLKDIKKNIDSKNENLKNNILELINHSDFNKGKICDNISNEITNKYINQNKEYLKIMDDINDIIKDNKEAKEDSITKKDENHEIFLSEHKDKEENFGNLEKEKIFLTCFPINFDRDRKKFFNDKNLFKAFNQEEYYEEFEIFKKELNREILNIK